VKYVNFGVCIALSAVLMVGCKGKKEVSETKTGAVQHGAAAPVAGAQSASLHSGTVLTTMNAGGYTYMEIEESGEKVWIAAPQFSVKVGEKVGFSQGAWMQNFKSKTLNRTFDKILFVSGVNGAGGSGGSSAAIPQAGHGGGNKYGIPKSKVSGAPTAGSIEKADGGYTVAELFANKAAIAGKVVSVRGKVVKVSRNIMGKNWIHIQDGTGSDGTNDVTFTSKGQVADVGSTVVAKGTLAADKDFGAGYKYSVIIENSEFSK